MIWWVELHGDRAGYDDPAIVTGIGSMDGKTYMFVGHQKGRNTKENIACNFAMPTPHRYFFLNSYSYLLQEISITHDFTYNNGLCLSKKLLKLILFFKHHLHFLINNG